MSLYAVHQTCLAAIICGVAALCSAADYPTFNTRAGVNSFTPAYQFDRAKDGLFETADRSNELGVDVFKCELSSHAKQTYGIDISGVDNLTSLVQTKTYQHLLGLPFKTYMFWVWPVGIENSNKNQYWRDGYTVAEQRMEYDEIYNLACYLLLKYNRTGKHFLVGHWEGDWTARGDYKRQTVPSEAVQNNMVAWLKNRQAAITAARAAIDHENVEVYNYAEVNLVEQEPGKPPIWTMTDNILPRVSLDLVSYSAWDICAKQEFNPLEAKLALDQVQSKAVFSQAFPGTKKVFIGEHGLPRIKAQIRPPCIQPLPGCTDLLPRCTELDQALRSREVLECSLNWGAPFCMYWEMYNNEVLNKTQLGFWMVDTSGTKQQVWYEHEDFLAKANVLKNQTRYWLNRNPTEEEFNAFAGSYTSFKPSTSLEILLDNLSASRFSDEQYLAFLFLRLLNISTPSAQHEYSGYLAQLSNGSQRSRILRSILGSPAFSRALDDNSFADYLYLSTLGRRTIDRGSQEYLSTLSQLVASGRFAVWRQFQDSSEFLSKELQMREDDTIGSTAVAVKQFFDLSFPASSTAAAH